ncbi:MAG: nucleotidyltransferase domain-containing protein [Armatimonadota bacterium]
MPFIQLPTPEPAEESRLDWDALRPAVTEELLQAITHRIVATFHPVQVILFGSHASGIPHAESDVDLLVVMPTEESPAQRILRVSQVARVPFLPMDLLVVTPDEMTARLSQGDPFLREVVARGRVLYSR